MNPTTIEGDIMFDMTANPFGTDAFVAPANYSVYAPAKMKKVGKHRMPKAPKPLSHHVKNFLLNYNG